MLLFYLSDDTCTQHSIGCHWLIVLIKIGNVSWSLCGEKDLTLDDDDDDLIMLLLVVLIETSVADVEKVIVMMTKTMTLAVLASNGCKYSFL